MKDRIIIDLDGTLTDDFDSKSNYQKKIDHEMIQALEKAIESKLEVKVFTERGMSTFSGDIRKIKKVHYSKLKRWFEENSFKFEDVEFGKPYCGENGFYIDDKALYIEDFKLRYLGSMKDFNISIICPFFNEEGNVKSTHISNMKAARILNIFEFLYIDNGSKDNTRKEIELLSKQDPRVRLISIDNNIGYGGAVKLGFKESCTEYCIITHGDNQFDIYGTYRNLACFEGKERKEFSVLPLRMNRSRSDKFATTLLRLILSIMCFRHLPDFNGQPKLVYKPSIEPIDTLPKGFQIDLEIALRILKKPYYVIPSIQQKRIYGQSSWNIGFLSKIKVFFQYLNYAITRNF